MSALKKIEIVKLKSTFNSLMSKAGWGIFMEDFVNSEDFNRLMQDLMIKHSTEGLTPNIKEVFRAFTECPYHELNTVIVGQDPYPTPGVADGIAFSCGHTKKEQPSLRIIFDEIQNTVYGSKPYSRDPDLTRWASQGVLMLNTALTTKPGKIGEHYKIWEKFTTYVFEKLSKEEKGLIYVFMGSEAKVWASFVSDDNYKIFCYHPASAVYSGGQWKSNDMFNKVNQILEADGQFKITW